MSEQPEHPKQDPQAPEHSGEPEAAAAPPGATEPQSAGSEATS
jgi:hypothetical protein